MYARALEYKSDVPASSWCVLILAMSLQSNMGCSVIIGYRENTKYLKPGTERHSIKEESDHAHRNVGAAPRKVAVKGVRRKRQVNWLKIFS
jgi:hypothetical protein